nr:hypothetical protein [Marivita cryptomonadis]
MTQLIATTRRHFCRRAPTGGLSKKCDTVQEPWTSDISMNGASLWAGP